MNGLFKYLGHTNVFDIKYGDVKRIPFITSTTNDKMRVFAETIILRFGSFVDAFGEEESGSGTILDEIREMENEDGMEDVA